MVTWTDNPPERPAPGTEPRPAWSRLLEILGLAEVFGPIKPLPGADGPCCGPRLDPAQIRELEAS
jgi:hypothetical protein